MKLIIKEIYLDCVLDTYIELFDVKTIPYDDDTGIYKLTRINLKIKSWNRNVEPLNKTGFNSGDTVANLIHFISKTEKYWFDFENERNEDEMRMLEQNIDNTGM